MGRATRGEGTPAGARERSPGTLRERAIALLARRDYARTELRQRLLRGDHGAVARAEVDALLDELVALGYLSDERFAQTTVTRKSGSYSRRAIAEGLKAQGVASETVAEALAGAGVDDDVALLALWQRRFGRAPRDEREKARQVRFLQSRGFDLSAIFKLLRSLPGEEA
jgi:regulatory protein